MSNANETVNERMLAAGFYRSTITPDAWVGSNAAAISLLTTQGTIANAPAVLGADDPLFASDEMLSVFNGGRPLSYPLQDYWSAPGDGPLHFQWQDKPHRLLYDLISAILYYTRTQSQPSAQPSDTPIITDEMVKAYLAENDKYWRETDAMPSTNPSKFRNGTPAEATKVSLIAALAAAPQVAQPSAEVMPDSVEVYIHKTKHGYSIAGELPDDTLLHPGFNKLYTSPPTVDQPTAPIVPSDEHIRKIAHDKGVAELCSDNMLHGVLRGDIDARMLAFARALLTTAANAGKDAHGAVDAERYQWATALEDNAETLCVILRRHGGNQAKIDERVDAYRLQSSQEVTP